MERGWKASAMAETPGHDHKSGHAGGESAAGGLASTKAYR